jgi:peroxiredoxin
MATIKVGDKAPDFTLPDTDMKPRSLHEFLGRKIILAFFVGAFTATCTKEACSFRDYMARLTDLEAQVIGISVNDPVSNKSFSEKSRLPYPILSDYNREVIKCYELEQTNASRLAGCVIAKRAIFILDKEGLIRYRWIASDSTVEPDYQEVQDALTKIV